MEIFFGVLSPSLWLVYTFPQLFLLMATPMARGSSQARNGIQAAAAAMPDPLTHDTRPGVELAPLQQPELLQLHSKLTAPVQELPQQCFRSLNFYFSEAVFFLSELAPFVT